MEGCDAGNDADCVPSCGNGVVEPGERCDGSCPTACLPPTQCISAILEGERCAARCHYAIVSSCVNGDGCCPNGCTANDDEDCSVTCGNGAVEAPRETCEPSSDAGCPDSCEDGNACTTDHMTGSPAACNVACGHTEIQSCASGDGCCAPGCNWNNDRDCAAACGNNVVELPFEQCDGNCIADCGTGDTCTHILRIGSPEECNVECKEVPISECIHDDGCCAPGCLIASDNDCPGVCGDGKIEGVELCENGTTKPCPTAATCLADACNPGTLRLAESDNACTAYCDRAPVTVCASSDGCCAPGCAFANDNDCPKPCGNGAHDDGETCDGDCPSSCDDDDLSTDDIEQGDRDQCTFYCSNVAITDCKDDGYCALLCHANSDPDCDPACGNDVVEAGETCDGNCVEHCDDDDITTDDMESGSRALCTYVCTNTPIAACKADGYCLPGCNANNDADCGVVCGNGVKEAGEACDDGNTAGDCDYDGDGYTDPEETTAGTDPCYSQSYSLSWSGPNPAQAHICETYGLALQGGTAVKPVQVNLSFDASNERFFSDSACTTPTNTLTLAQGSASLVVYFKPTGKNLMVTLRAADAAEIVAPGTYAVAVPHIPFGDGGSFVGPSDGYAGGDDDVLIAAALDAEERIIAVGYTTLPNGSVRSLVVRLTQHGSVDATFGPGGQGYVLGPDAGFHGGGLVDDRFFAITIDTQGRILAGGRSLTSSPQRANALLVRYLADGRLDTGFGEGGRVAAITTDTRDGPRHGFAKRARYVQADSTFDANPEQYADNLRGVAIASDGAILVVGGSRDAVHARTHSLVARYTAAGVLDVTFNADAASNARGDSRGFSLNGDMAWQSFDGAGYSDLDWQALQPAGSGKWWAAGWKGEFGYLLARYQADGNLDLTFNGSGYRLTVENGAMQTPRHGWHTLAARANGGALAVGFHGYHAAVGAYTQAGGFDASFANATYTLSQGLLKLDNASPSAQYQKALGGAVDSQGRLVVAITAGPQAGDVRDTAGGVYLMRFLGSGALDLTFGDGGITTLVDPSPFTGASFASGSDRGWQVLVDSEDRVLLVGRSDKRAVVARYLVNGELDD
jgi:uncharacterized delta-60 repeat protein